ncbi:MAG: hypothetical protein RBT01_04025 [Anaerolineaceae bacterium]|nr:hypothetical protein [Anaerolineaceae bacterium]
MNSSATSQANGYLAGYGTPEMLAEGIKRLGLSQSGKEYQQKSVSR